MEDPEEMKRQRDRWQQEFRIVDDLWREATDHFGAERRRVKEMKARLDRIVAMASTSKDPIARKIAFEASAAIKRAET